MQQLNADHKQNTMPDGMVSCAVRSNQFASSLQDIACVLGISESDVQGLADDGLINTIRLRSGEWLFPPIDKLVVLWGESSSNTSTASEMQTQVRTLYDDNKLNTNVDHEFVSESNKASFESTAVSPLPSEKSINEDKVPNDSKERTAQTAIQSTEASSASLPSKKEQQKSQCDDYLPEHINKIESYSELASNQKTKLIDSHKDTFESGKIPDYVTLTKSAITKRNDSKYLCLSFRSNKKLKMLLNQKSGVMSLKTSDPIEAKARANELLHQASIDKGVSLIDFQGKTLNDAFSLLYKKKKSEDKKSKKAKSKKAKSKKAKSKESSSNENEELGPQCRRLVALSHLMGDIPLSQVDETFIYFTFMSMEECDWASATMNTYASDIRQSLDLAKSLGLIKAVPSIPSFQSNRRDLIELPWDTWSKFIDAYAINPLDKLFLELLWCTGLRLTLVLMMEETQIDLDKKIFHIPESKNKAKVMCDVPLSDQAIACIKKIYEYKAKNNITDKRLFADSNGKMLKLSRARIRKACKQSGLPESFVLHQTRHYFATDMRRKGATIETIAAAGGWKSREGVLRYIHTGVNEAEFQAVNSRT